jgi:hypothetical protein
MFHVDSFLLSASGSFAHHPQLGDYIMCILYSKIRNPLGSKERLHRSANPALAESL